jgi:predicted small secreted protein
MRKASLAKLSILLLLGAFGLSACDSTMEGAGEDVEEAGDEIEEKTE